MHFYLFGLDFLCVLQYNKREVIIMYGQNIRLFRKQKGMNQHELGAAMDVSAVSVSKWEREQTQPDIETLQKTNQELISTLEEVRQIQADGAKKRAEAEVELGRIEGELKQKLLELRG